MPQVSRLEYQRYLYLWSNDTCDFRLGIQLYMYICVTHWHGNSLYTLFVYKQGGRTVLAYPYSTKWSSSVAVASKDTLFGVRIT